MKKSLGILLVFIALTCSSCGLILVFVGAGFASVANQPDFRNFGGLNFGMRYQDTDDEYQDKYANQMEEGSEILRTWYHYTVEDIGNTDFILKIFNPDTKQITDFYTYSTARLIEKDGDCKEWWDNGNKKLEGLYEEDKKKGEWSYYDAQTGKKGATGFYRKDVKEGPWKYFNVETGDILLQVNFSNNERNGPFMIFNDAGEIIGKGRYFNGELDTIAWETTDTSAYLYLMDYEYPANRYNVDELPTLKDCKKFEFESSRTSCTEEMITEAFDTLYVPDVIYNRRIEGTAIMSFTVTTDGKMKDISIDRGLCDEIKEMCEEVLEALPDWTPAIKNGEPIKMRYSIQHSFDRVYDDESEGGTNM